ncbi:MAG TPA: rhomboid family intramembrane serine protease [Acidobacteriaceae bacterium]|jgi:rhomboid protease GluP
MEWKSPDSRPVDLEPEILPPLGRDATNAPTGGGTGQSDVRQPMANRPRRARWATAPATYALVAVNCLVYLAMMVSGVSWKNPSVTDLLRWGANAGPYVLIGHQWWRLITAAFVHAGPLHIATNMWCLWNLGLLGEPLLGAFGILAVYLLSGAAGNLLSIALHPGVPNGPAGIVGVGASGAVFGLAGVLIVLLKSPLLPVPPVELRQLRRSVINFAILNFVFGASTLFFPSVVRIDNMAHLGGFLCGFALGIPLVPRIGAPRNQFLIRRRIAYGGMTLLLLVFAFGIVSFWR